MICSGRDVIETLEKITWIEDKKCIYGYCYSNCTFLLKQFQKDYESSIKEIYADYENPSNIPTSQNSPTSQNNYGDEIYHILIRYNLIYSVLTLYLNDMSRPDKVRVLEYCYTQFFTICSDVNKMIEDDDIHFKYIDERYINMSSEKEQRICLNYNKIEKYAKYIYSPFFFNLWRNMRCDMDVLIRETLIRFVVNDLCNHKIDQNYLQISTVISNSRLPDPIIPHIDVVRSNFMDVDILMNLRKTYLKQYIQKYDVQNKDIQKDVQCTKGMYKKYANNDMSDIYVMSDGKVVDREGLKINSKDLTMHETEDLKHFNINKDYGSKRLETTLKLYEYVSSVYYKITTNVADSVTFMKGSYIFVKFMNTLDKDLLVSIQDNGFKNNNDHKHYFKFVDDFEYMINENNEISTILNNNYSLSTGENSIVKRSIILSIYIFFMSIFIAEKFDDADDYRSSVETLMVDIQPVLKYGPIDEQNLLFLERIILRVVEWKIMIDVPLEILYNYINMYDEWISNHEGCDRDVRDLWGIDVTNITKTKTNHINNDVYTKFKDSFDLVILRTKLLLKFVFEKTGYFFLYHQSLVTLSALYSCMCMSGKDMFGDDISKYTTKSSFFIDMLRDIGSNVKEMIRCSYIMLNVYQIFKDTPSTIMRIYKKDKHFCKIIM
jgi:hypothetical protein